MFAFSTKTAVNRVFKLADLHRQIKSTRDARQEALFIESVTLTNVLSPATLNCEGDKTVKEVYVFEIKVKKRFVPVHFIKELDANIKLHTLFNVRDGEWELSMISFKIGSEKGKYHQTNWTSRNDMPVPPADNVPALYKFILSKFLPYLPFERETAEEYVRRNNILAKLNFQIEKLSQAIASESQSKKKFEYNAKLKLYKEERDVWLNDGVNDR